MLRWREFLGILILFDIGWISSAPMLCHLPDSYNKGHCVTIKECTAIDLSVSIVSPDAFEDFVKRKESCSAFGSNLVCCEITKYASQFDPITMMSSISTSEATTISIATTTTSVATTITSKVDSTTEAPPKLQEIVVKSPELNDISEHEHFKLLNDKNCGKSKAKRVANGENAEVLEFPWIVRLRYQGNKKAYYGCGGSLISEYFVLTAAHCVVNTKKIIQIRLGEYNETSEVDCNEDMVCADPVQDLEVASIKSHPDYDPVKVINDIALIRLKQPARLSNNNINTVCLPLDETSAKRVGPNLQVIGWGGTENSTSHPILQKAQLPPVNISECEVKFAKLKKLNLSDNQLCAGGVAKVDSCKGDSGGPLLGPARVHTTIRTVQFGIVSYGVKSCGEKSYPGIYTNVKSYLNWILDNMS